jgi:hypothetical protein
MELSGPKIASSPMSSAPFVWRSDGRPDWRVMWGDFCELALFGGPPHRGPENPLRAVVEPDPLVDTVGIIAEIQRGIWETTGLDSDLVRAGWLGILSRGAWRRGCAAIPENVDALCEDECLLVPASERFTVENEVSIITVVAKIHHYRIEHVCGRADQGQPAAVAAARQADRGSE